MKIFYCFLTLLFCPLFLSAQEIPAESSKATVLQRVGLSDITISYYRPNVKERKIFGGLTPYGEVWRTGANYPTFITLTDTTFIEGANNVLLPDTYALYTIPYADKWTVIFSKNITLWGAYGYDAKDDALRVDVKADTASLFTETFLIDFANVTHNEATICLHWANTVVGFKVKADISRRVLAYIKEEIEKGAEEPHWGIYWQGADYLLDDGGDRILALEWINKSIAIKQTWINMWTKAQIHAAMGNFKEAANAGQKALEIGTSEDNAPYFHYTTYYSSEIEKWRHK